MISALLSIGVVLFFLFLFTYLNSRSELIDMAKSHGVLIDGAHYKVYKIYCETSYTDGGVYVRHHGVKDFNEILLVSPDNKKTYISESHFRYCLKVKKHPYKTVVNGKSTRWWSEWRIDPNGRDEIFFDKPNDIYLSIY